MNEKFKYLASNTVVFAVGNAFSKAFQFILLPIYTAYMTEAEYGVGELLSNLSQLVYPVIALCLYEAIFRFVLDRGGEPKVVFSTGLMVVSLLLPIALVVGALLELFLGIEAAFLCSLLSATTAMRLCIMNFARGLGAVKRFAVSGVVGTIALLCGAYLFICLMQMGASGYLLNILFSDACVVAFLFFACKIWRYVDVKSFSKPLLKEMLRYSLPLLPNAIFWWFTNVFNRYMVLFACGAGAAGLYAAAGKLPSLVHFLSTIFQQAWQISAVQEYESENEETSFYSKTFSAFNFVLILGTSLLLASIYPLSALLLRGGFIAGWVFGPGLVLAAAVTCYTAFFTTFLNAAKDTVPILKSTILGAIVNVAACFGLISTLGEWGAIIASVAGQVVILIYQVRYLRNSIRLSVDRIAIAAGVATIVAQSIVQSIFGVDGVIVSAMLFVALAAFYFIRHRPAINAFVAGIKNMIKKS